MFHLQPYTIENCHRHIRTYFGGVLIGSSRHGVLYLDRPYPIYYFPQSDVEMQHLVASSRKESDSGRGDRVFWHLTVGSTTARNAASTYTNPPAPAHADLGSYITFDWNVMDSWYEEREQVFGHPKNPYHRIDILASERNLNISVSNLQLAQTSSPMVLFETGLPIRYYVNRKDINLDVLEPSDTVTCCPYKGFANYFNIKTGSRRLIKDGAWCYADPLPECAKIKGRICFYNEIVDIIEDGQQLKRPRTQIKL